MDLNNLVDQAKDTAGSVTEDIKNQANDVLGEQLEGNISEILQEPAQVILSSIKEKLGL